MFHFQRGLVVVARTEDAEILRRATALAETDADVLLVDGVRDAERSPVSVE
jgi:hypothetical protein